MPLYPIAYVACAASTEHHGKTTATLNFAAVWWGRQTHQLCPGFQPLRGSQSYEPYTSRHVCPHAIVSSVRNT